MNDVDHEHDIAVFANAIHDPAFRRAFVRDPDGTLAGVGVNINDLPSGVQAFLRDLSYEELRVLSRLQETMVEAGMSTDEPSVHTLAKF